MKPLAALLAAFVAGFAHGAVVHSERSLYQNILVTESGQLRCLQFSVRHDQRNQSCRDLRAPDRLVFSYTRMMLASLLLVPEPRQILVVGLGGGSLPSVLARVYPDANVDVVEIDPAVVRVARAYFDFAPSARVRVFEQDARVWGKRALARPTRYDLILLDAFNGDYIPEHLMTREYLEETHALLTENGVLAANTFAISELYDHESVTYEAVFGPFLNLEMPDSANRVIVASRTPLPAADALESAALRLQPRFARFGVELTGYPARMSRARDWETDARILTDQYAPANLLRERERR
jgi:spermidine synthase